MHEQVSVKGCGIEEAPTVGKTPHVASVPLTQAITGLAANYWLECSRVWPSTLICLHIKLHTFLGKMRRNPRRPTNPRKVP
eukprot:s380_g12.t1